MSAAIKVVKLPPLVLALALQVMPFSRAFVALTPAGGSSFAIVSTWIAGALALLGSVDAVSGASTTITSPKTATATNGVPFSYRITTGPEVANTFAATPLPPALTVSTTSGRITGTPTVDGVFVIHLTASDSGRLDRTVRADLTLTILPPGGGGVPTAPSITTQPQSQTVTNGGSTTFTVVATGTAPLTYGWRFNGNPLAGATNSTLTLSSVTTNQAGNYSVVVTNSVGSVTSSVATLTVLVRPAITSQPASQSVTAGANVSFNVAASGTTPLSYQWKRNNVNVTGGTTSTLALTAVTTNQAGSYTCVVTNSAGAVTSAVATLTVLVPPTITTQPASQTVTAGANVSLSVVASGTAPLSYQWLLNGVNASGATSATLALTGVTTNQAGSYTCLVSNSAGAVTSSAATLTVRVPPTITTQPVSQSVTAGANVSFSVEVIGTTPLSYQWKRNGVNVTGGTSAMLSLTAVTTNQAGSYTCVVTNSAGSATSAAAILTVNLAPVASTITAQPQSKTVTNGGSTTLTVVAAGTAPLNYQWELNGVDVAGATSSMLTLTGVTTNQAGSYTCVVSNSVGSVTSSAATLVVLLPPVITTQPASQAVTVGANVDLSVVASGTTPLSCQWRRNGVNVSGATSATLSLTAVTTNQAGSYTCVVTNSAGSATSSAATLAVNLAPVPPTITTQPANQSVTAGANVSFSVVANGTAPLSYQWQLNGADVPGATSATLSLMAVTTNQTGSYSCVVTNSVGAVTSSAATLTVRVPPTITTQPVSQSVTAGANVSFSVEVNGTTPLSYQWKRNGVNVSGATSATLALTAVTTNQAGSYTCVVTNSAGSATSAAATLTVNLAPVAPTITTQPASQSVTAGANVSLSLVASGTAPLSYQWQFNGVDVAGATSATLSLTGVTTNQAGSYLCVVTNSVGSATSSAATLTVNPAPIPPAITTQPQSQTVTAGVNVSLSVEVNGTTPLTYQWQRNGVSISGATGATLNLTAVTTNQAGSYTCVVTNSAGSVTSSVATLTVLVPPAIRTQPASQSVTVGANVSFSVVASGSAPLGYQWLLDGVNVAGATSSTLALTGVSTNQAGNYTCVVTNSAGNAISSAATLTVTPAPIAPTITTQPQNRTVTAGADVSLNVDVNGTAPLSFQWRRNGVNVSGAITATLNLTAVTTNQAGSYTCVVTNSAGTVTSAVATLTVLVPPTITTQPVSQTVTVGANVSFGVGISGTAPLSYQWQFNGVEVSGATSSTLALTGVTTNQAGSYTCMVTNSVGAATSSVATLTVNSESVSPSSTFTVVTNGDGAVFGIPAPQTVIEGRVYTLTAVGGEGQMFAGWTGSTNSLSPTLVVKARTNLFLRANFVPLNLTLNGNGTVTPNLKKTRNLIPGRTYTVTAAGAPGQMFIGWSGSTNSTSPRLSFAMSSNLNVQANFVPVNVTVNGTGTLSPDLRKTLNLIPGRVYTVRALPGVGQEFAGWSGSLDSPLPSLSVVLTTNLNLQANFIPSPYIPIVGTFRGLFYEDSGVRPHASGYFSVAVTARGTYSGWLQTAITRHSFTGKLGLDCRGTNVIPRPYFNPLKLTMHFGSGPEIDLVNGQVGDTNWTATVLGDRLVFNTLTHPAPYAGNYTLVLPGQAGTNSMPEGDGFGTLRVTASGLTTFAATMGDGARVTQSSGISKNGRWALHSVLAYGTARGAVIGWMNFADRSGDDLNGTVIWTKPPNLLGRYYQLGFHTECQAVGSIYRTPVGPQTNYVLNLSQAEVAFNGGNVAPGFTNSILFGPYSRVSNLSGNPMTLSFSTTLGTYSGSVTDPTTLRPFAFRGAVLQKQNAGFGFLTGTNRTSRVRVGPSN